MLVYYANFHNTCNYSVEVHFSAEQTDFWHDFFIHLVNLFFKSFRIISFRRSQPKRVNEWCLIQVMAFYCVLRHSLKARLLKHSKYKIRGTSTLVHTYFCDINYLPGFFFDIFFALLLQQLGLVFFLSCFKVSSQSLAFCHFYLHSTPSDWL